LKAEATMSKLEIIEGQIKELSREELAQLREWLARFDAEVWDHQFEADVKAGKLDALERMRYRTTLRDGQRSCEPSRFSCFLGLLPSSSSSGAGTRR
jgi:hypothetical protein